MRSQKLMYIEFDYDGQTFEGTIPSYDGDVLKGLKELSLREWDLKLPEVLDFNLYFNGNFTIEFKNGTKTQGFAKFVDSND
ncbi:MAG: hypothetical protein ACP5G1_03755 [Nanopusillaceae archaeon]